MKNYMLSAAVNLAVENFLRNLRAAFPSTSWAGVQHYAERAWFAADEPGVSWDQVESRLKDGWSGQGTDIAPILMSASPDREREQLQKSHRYVSLTGPRNTGEANVPSNQSAVTGAEYEEWSVGRRSLQDLTKSGRAPFRDPQLDYGSHG